MVHIRIELKLSPTAKLSKVKVDNVPPSSAEPEGVYPVSPVVTSVPLKLLTSR
jgi:hypothetical protein